jgi:hypothetical protein
MPDPVGTWQSLNWINVIQVLKISKSYRSISIQFNNLFMEKVIERIAYDENFAQRRSPLLCYILLKLLNYNLHKIIKYIPMIFQPVIDCQIIKLRRLE